LLLISLTFHITAPSTSIGVVRRRGWKRSAQRLHCSGGLWRSGVNCFANMAGVGDQPKAGGLKQYAKLSSVLHSAMPPNLNKLLKIHWPVKSMEELKNRCSGMQQLTNKY
jgi:hypothetical protein